MSDGDDTFGRLAQTAADLGPAIEPPGYRDLLEAIVSTTRELTGAAACSIALLDEKEEELEFVAASGAGAEAIVGTRMDAHKGIAGWSLASGQSITVGQVSDDPRFARDVAEATGYVPQSILAIPLETDRGSLGVMEILDARDEGDPDRVRAVGEIVALLATQAALAVEQTLVFKDLGRVLFQAAADAALNDTDLAEALADAASRTRGPSREIGDLAAILYELGRLGPEERGAATNLLAAFMNFALGARPQL